MSKNTMNINKVKQTLGNHVTEVTDIDDFNHFKFHTNINITGDIQQINVINTTGWIVIMYTDANKAWTKNEFIQKFSFDFTDLLNQIRHYLRDYTEK